MSDEENRAGQQEEEQVKSEDPNAPINIKVCGGVFLWVEVWVDIGKGRAKGTGQPKGCVGGAGGGRLLHVAAVVRVWLWLRDWESCGVSEGDR